MEEDNIYLISGKNILKFLDLIDDLRDLSLSYVDDREGDALDLENKFHMLREDILKSDIFSEINFDDLLKKSYSMEEILDKVGLTLKGRK